MFYDTMYPEPEARFVPFFIARFVRAIFIYPKENVMNIKANNAQKHADNVNFMSISDNGINMLKSFEGCVKIGNKHVVYDDQTGAPLDANKPLPRGATIGYGHLIKPDEDFTNGITENAATELLLMDIATAERAIKNNICVQLSQNQYDALVSLAYNIGATNFAKSTVVKYINNPKFHSSIYPNLESAWKAWNRSQGKISKGLIQRRQNEWDFYNDNIL